MDERAMMTLDFLHDPPLSLLLPVCLLAGMGLGYAYFRMLRMTAELVVSHGHPLRGAALTLARLGLMTVGLYVAVQAGATALLATLAGILIAKGLLLQRSPPSPSHALADGVAQALTHQDMPHRDMPHQETSHASCRHVSCSSSRIHTEEDAR